jgi:hypothetical protein
MLRSSKNGQQKKRDSMNRGVQFLSPKAWAQVAETIRKLSTSSVRPHVAATPA